jgi:ribonuclease-3
LALAVCNALQPLRQFVVTVARESAELSGFAASQGLIFDDPGLLETALTHPSAASGTRGARPSYQRLEWLGDRVLGLVLAERLYRAYPNEEEGPLARRMAALASEPSLVRVARVVDLGRYLIVDAGEERNHGRENAANLADACEAVIGALYLDGGLEAARGFIETRWAPLIAEQIAPPKDPKSALQEWTQARGIGLPRYRMVNSSGPDHRPLFTISVEVDGHGAAQAEGGGKREAEAKAARRMMEMLEKNGD